MQEETLNPSNTSFTEFYLAWVLTPSPLPCSRENQLSATACKPTARGPVNGLSRTEAPPKCHSQLSSSELSGSFLQNPTHKGGLCWTSELSESKPPLSREH